MNAASLVQLAAARGIDLAHIAGIASNTEGIARERVRTADERESGMSIMLTVRGRETRGHRRPGWSHAELGQGCQRAWRGAMARGVVFLRRQP